MRFITEFENDGTKFDDALTDHRKEWRQNELGKLIADAFGWKERRPTMPSNPDAERYTLEIEAFPMDKWVEFKQKLFSEIATCNDIDFPVDGARILSWIKELESFGKPSEEDRIRNQGDSKCPHCNNPASSDFHQCPYKQDVHNDSISQCNCCDKCVNECAMDV